MKITSPAFENNTVIPLKYTCDGDGINPPLAFSDIPQNAKSLALIVEDPDAPGGTFIHWILFNMNTKITGIEENSVPESASQGKTSLDKTGYVPACPPTGIHRYIFKLYALNTILNIDMQHEDSLKDEMQNHIIDEAEFIGLYGKSNS